MTCVVFFFFCLFFSSRRRHTRLVRDWSSDVCSSDLRLLNCYEKSAVSNLWDFFNVGAGMRMRLPAYGKKTEQEFQALLRNWAKARKPEPESSDNSQIGRASCRERV